ncbi:LiaI-LiaF-like domain-containing protein [Brevibacillus sp. B_LB10_24]|uniref:LiaI-LiaF-like domain-containing protein n=1 Tax=Brevibacillus sp. B_LB10_24 TaxID=3380645 RepID=UPI0038BAD86C
MRQWRIGTLSMGVSLIILGAILFLSQWRGPQSIDWVFTWWPIVFILLGAEILIFLALSKSEQVQVKYDVFSIFFIGLLGSACIGLTLLASTGVLGEIRHAVASVDQIKDVPELSRPVPQEVKRIVVQSAGVQVRMERTAGRDVHLFGTYRVVTSAERDEPDYDASQFAAIHTVGDTMYVTLKRPPERRGFSSYSSRVDLVLVLPKDVTVENQE